MSKQSAERPTPALPSGLRVPFEAVLAEIVARVRSPIILGAIAFVVLLFVGLRLVPAILDKTPALPWGVLGFGLLVLLLVVVEAYLKARRQAHKEWQEREEALRWEEAARWPRVTEPTKEIELEFANRETELLRLKAPIDNPGAPRYVQVYGPCGLGKTYLLKKCLSEYQEAGWLCAWLDFNTDELLRHQSALILRQLGGQFEAGVRTRTCADLVQRVVQARRRSVIFLDAVDLASGEVRRWIKTDLIPALEERILDPTIRPCVIAAGRHPIREWAVYSRQRFDGFPLTPFTDRVVDDLLRRLAHADGYTLPDSFFQQTTEAVLFITKGHPAAIKRVLQKIRESSFTMPSHEVMQRDTFNQTVGALLGEEILALHVPERLRETFKTLCVLRGYTPSLLDRLGWMPAQEYISYDLVGELSKTHLVEMPDSSPLYRLEPLIRQMVALQMEYNDKERFLELNEAAVSVFEEQVRGQDQSGTDLPDRPTDRMQVALAVEALYHHAVLLKHRRIELERARKELQDKVKEYLSCRQTRENDKYWVDLLLGTIEKDAELTALIYELIGNGGLESVLLPLYTFVGNEEG